MRKKGEQLLQELFCQWLNSQGILYTASMVGVNLPIRYAALRKRMGVKAGHPDLVIYEPKGNYHGLFIELKTKGGNVKDEKQLNWQKELIVRGYEAIIMPNDLGEIKDELDWLICLTKKYMALKPKEELCIAPDVKL